MVIKVKDNRPYVIRSKDNKYEWTRCWDVEEAKEIIEEFERIDKIADEYKENAYEIFNDRTKEVIL